MTQQSKESKETTPYKTFAPNEQQMPNFCRAVQHLINAIAKQPKEDFIDVNKGA